MVDDMAGTRLLVLLMLGICAAARSAEPSAADSLDAALEQRIRGQAGLEDVEIAAEWQRDAGHTSARVWGNGIGVWQDRAQFRMSRDEVVSLLKMLSAAKVGAMRSPDAKPTPAAPAKAPIRVLGELTVVVGSERKTLRQVNRGEHSEPLRELVLAVLSFCEKAAKTGVTASSLQDGLEKLAEGTLAPETFEAVVQYREDSKARAGESWLLRMNGLRITDRLLPKGESPPPPRTLTLSREQFQRIARGLEESDLAALPNNPYAASYTDVRIEVLGQSRTIPARAYFGITPETHGATQQSFDRLVAGFRALHDLVQKEGSPAADEKGSSVGPARPPATPAPTSSPAAP